MNTDRFKFRAWDTCCNRMRYEEDYAIVPDTGKPHWIHDQELIQGEAEQLILMQCIGLKDIEGKLIYEGDIIEVWLNGEYSIKQLLQVVFKEMSFWYMDEDGELFRFFPGVHLKVAGNIYENPNLFVHV